MITNSEVLESNWNHLINNFCVRGASISVVFVLSPEKFLGIELLLFNCPPTQSCKKYTILKRFLSLHYLEYMYIYLFCVHGILVSAVYANTHACNV